MGLAEGLAVEGAGYGEDVRGLAELHIGRGGAGQAGVQGAWKVRCAV